MFVRRKDYDEDMAALVEALGSVADALPFLRGILDTHSTALEALLARPYDWADEIADRSQG